MNMLIISTQTAQCNGIMKHWHPSHIFRTFNKYIMKHQKSGKKLTRNREIKDPTCEKEAFHIVLQIPEIEPKPLDDLFVKLRFFIVLGRLLGVLPVSGVFKNSYKNIYFGPKGPGAITSIVILAAFVLHFGLGILHFFRHPKSNLFEIFQSVRRTIGIGWVGLIYLNFLRRGKKFVALFHHWATTSIFYTTEDRHLKRDMILVTILILTSAILENAVLHLEYIEGFDLLVQNGTGNSQLALVSPLEIYYKRSHSHWARVIPFHEIWAAIAFVQHKFMLYSWNYLDIMICVFSRAIYFKFKVLYRLGYEHLVKPLKEGNTSSQNKHGWIQLVQDHKKLCDLLRQFESFFSPLIFGSYIVNIYYICMHLLDGIVETNTHRSIIHSIYGPWSFLHLIIRVYFVSISGARINTYAHQIRDVLEECPKELYSSEIARTDKKVTAGPEIGLTGWGGAFTITKPFMLTIISVVFTFEIVLLQGLPSNRGKNEGGTCP